MSTGLILRGSNSLYFNRNRKRLTGMTDYKTFVEAKSQLTSGAGFKPIFLPGFLFDFQNYLTVEEADKFDSVH